MASTPQIESSSHLRVSLAASLRRQIVREACKLIRKQCKKMFGVHEGTTKPVMADAIAVSGHSGLIVGSAVADRLGMDLIIVRRPGEKNSTLPCHSSYLVEGHVKGAPRFIVLDDLICTGNTHSHILSSIHAANGAAKWCGTLLYFDSMGSWFQAPKDYTPGNNWRRGRFDDNVPNYLGIDDLQRG